MSESFCNKVITLDLEDFKSIKKELEFNNRVFVFELDGANIQSWRKYISEIQNKFQFLTPCFDSYDRYLDWMRDLEWLNEEEFMLIINNFSCFLKDNSELKKEIVSDFIEIILPFWQDEVEKVVIDGKAKSFLVYLIA